MPAITELLTSFADYLTAEPSKKRKQPSEPARIPLADSKKDPKQSKRKSSAKKPKLESVPSAGTSAPKKESKKGEKSVPSAGTSAPKKESKKGEKSVPSAGTSAPKKESKKGEKNFRKRGGKLVKKRLKKLEEKKANAIAKEAAPSSGGAKPKPKKKFVSNKEKRKHNVTKPVEPLSGPSAKADKSEEGKAPVQGESKASPAPNSKKNSSKKQQPFDKKPTNDKKSLDNASKNHSKKGQGKSTAKSEHKSSKKDHKEDVPAISDAANEPVDAAPRVSKMDESLTYLWMWKNQRDSWKFMKVRQTTLLKNK
jgi:hypothetical protein